MTLEVFTKQMDKLRDVFGDQQFKGRMDIIFDIVKKLPPERFAWICKHFIMSRKTFDPPLPNDFLEETNKQLSLMANGPKGMPSEINDLQPPSDYLEKLLKDMGVVSLKDAIEKRKRKQGEGA